MIIFCEECGERYIIEPEDIKGSDMIFICRSCNDIIKIPSQRHVSDHRKEEEPQSEKV